MNDDQGFNVELMTPSERRTKNRKLLRIGLTLGLMFLAVILLGLAMISYTIGYDNGFRVAKERFNLRRESNASASKDGDKAIPEAATIYQSPDKVGQGQIPDHYRGNRNAKIVAIEYADFTCSHCIALSEKLGDIYSKYGDKVQFIFRHYEVGFTYSDVTTRISEAAYLIGGEEAYWRMTDQLFNDNAFAQGEYLATDQLDNKIKALAQNINIDGQAVLDAYNNSANNGIQAKINRDRQFAEQSGVDGTPSWFINGKPVRGTAEALEKKLKELIK